MHCNTQSYHSDFRHNPRELVDPYLFLINCYLGNLCLNNLLIGAECIPNFYPQFGIHHACRTQKDLLKRRRLRLRRRRHDLANKSSFVRLYVCVWVGVGGL